MTTVLVIDYGAGNLASVKRALEECGADAVISDDPSDIQNADKLILPGVGSFAKAMQRLTSVGWTDALQKEAGNGEKPLLGICLGMQLLASSGEEHGDNPGLGLIPGTVTRLPQSSAAGSEPALRLPHVGWNEIRDKKNSPLLEGICDGTDFYFLHSYYFETENPDHVAARTPYGISFPSIIERGNIFGAQFHPEKSGPAGFQLLKNFLAA